MLYTFRAVTEADARAILAWRYPEPYAIYNADPATLDQALVTLLDPANAYFAALTPDGQVAGYCCFGADARVPGGDYSDTSALDVGLGLRPDLTGGGRGLDFVRAVLAFGRSRFAPARFRLTVAAFNLRAQRVYTRAAFRVAGRFRRGGDPAAPEFLLMVEDGGGVGGDTGEPAR
jgi:ribosomal-protein-alanine N-acetyltransferase